MEPIVLATWGLVVATLVLAVLGALQLWTVYRQGRNQAAAAAEQRQREEAQLTLYGRQAESLSSSAAASRAMATEMRAARIEGNRLLLRFNLHEAAERTIEGAIENMGERAVIVRLLEYTIGEGSEPFLSRLYANQYLAPRDGMFASESFPSDQGDLLIIRVHGRPADGIEQTVEFLFRIGPDYKPIDLGPSGFTWTAA